ncbi:TPM domain-containing protein [bacterium]|nr:MAG: TPM domain-containing protein [bacterium]
MKRKLGLLFFGVLFLTNLLFAEDIPQPSGWVNDFANVISAEYQNKLNAAISALEEKTSAEIAVVTINSIAPYDEKEYARLLFDNWKPGKKGKDNGVLILLSIKERAWRIETGYGVEGVLPDGRCGEIGRNYMVPYFKSGNYEEGLYNGVLAIAQVISPQYSSPAVSPPEETPLFAYIFAFVFLSMITRFFIWRKLPKNKRNNFFGPLAYGGTYSSGGGSWGGGGFGGGGFGGGGFGGGGGGGGGAGGRF